MSTSTAPPAKSVAGILEKDTDVRVIPMTRRPDGTIRKERKVRPGYTPPEDVAKYTNQVLNSARPVAPSSSSSLNSSSAPKTKTQMKNDKRKAKRKEEAAVIDAALAAGSIPEQLSNNATSTEQKQESAADTITTATAHTSVDPEKKLRALNKKLRQVEQLKERQEKGETMLPEQIEKISKMDELLAQIAELSI
ncbi:hypothetical protein BGZ51_007940 [Haplosporangium sp. Z 767]|nr:hypothetical protein BGZ51_007940 [Haplosporangium sp. Z 767]